MKEYLKNPTVLMVGAGVLAFVLAHYLLKNKKEATKSSVSTNVVLKSEEKSDFCGCGA